MSFFSKYLIIVSCIGLIGIPVFILDVNDLAWENNKEIYWGMIALVALALAIVFENKAKIIQNNLNKRDIKKPI